jgi:hypothetical protein
MGCPVSRTTAPSPIAPRGAVPALLAGLALVLVAATALDAADSPVEGSYLGNGEAAELAHVRIIETDPWQGETSYTIVISEKDPSEVAKPDFDAMFGELGDALVVSVTESGEIFSTQVCHQSLEKSGFSSSGSLKIEGFKIEEGELSARFYTDGEQEFSGDRWQVDLKVTGELP